MAAVLAILVVLVAILEVGMVVVVEEVVEEVVGCVCSEEVYNQYHDSSYPHSSLGTGVVLVLLVVVLVLVDMDNTGVEWDPQVLQSLFSEIETL